MSAAGSGSAAVIMLINGRRPGGHGADLAHSENPLAVRFGHQLVPDSLLSARHTGESAGSAAFGGGPELERGRVDAVALPVRSGAIVEHVPVSDS